MKMGNRHSAFEDAEILMTICKSKSEIFNQQYGFKFENKLHHLDQKLPLPIQIVYTLAVGCSSHQQLTFLLYDKSAELVPDTFKYRFFQFL